MQALRVESVRACVPAYVYNQVPTGAVVLQGCYHLLIQKICCRYRGIVATTRLKQCVVLAGSKAVIFFCRLQVAATTPRLCLLQLDITSAEKTMWWCQ